MFREIEPFWSWHTPIAWTGYIFFIDGWIWHRRGESPLRNDRAEMVFLALISIPLWIIFEEYNKHTLFTGSYQAFVGTVISPDDPRAYKGPRQGRPADSPPPRAAKKRGGKKKK